MSITPELKTLFPSWPKFVPINDTLRGGSSTSSLVVSSDNTATFSGNLNITTLGGAGFASQNTSFFPSLSLPSSTYSGLTLLLPLPTLPLQPNQPTSFVLTLKNVIPLKRETGGGGNQEGRRESVISYEVAFDLRDLITQSRKLNSEGKDVEKGEKDDMEKLARVEMRWNEFKAYYRGREQKDAPVLDSTKLTELSFMCRSNFAQQSGDFNLRIHSLSATLLPTITDRSWLDRLRDWFIRIQIWLRGSQGEGRVKL